MQISEIPSLPDRERRFEVLFVDTYDVYEEFGGMGSVWATVPPSRSR
jgi:hypothetical protein